MFTGIGTGLGFGNGSGIGIGSGDSSFTGNEDVSGGLPGLDPINVAGCMASAPVNLTPPKGLEPGSFLHKILNNPPASPSHPPVNNRIRARRERRAERAAIHNKQQTDGYVDPQRRTTRSITAHFPLMRLVPELRNQIYSHVLGAPKGTLVAKQIQVPALFKTTKQVRNETLGLLTSLNNVHMDVRSTYCVISLGNAGQDHSRYQTTGSIMLGSTRKEWLKQGGVFFNSVRIHVFCICCTNNKVGHFDICLVGCRYVVRPVMKPVVNQKSLAKAFEQITKVVEALIKAAEGRAGFVGLTYRDLRKIASAFRST